jgi:dihydropteroate synthase
MKPLVPIPDNTRRTLIMGILNTTPDSFYDGGRWTDLNTAVSHGLRMVEEGADIIDVGGESSRPGSEPVTESEEQRRVLPVVEALAAQGVTVSVDTWRASTAEKALAAGAFMINDITGLRGDPRMAEVIAAAGCLCVIMHMQGTPKTMQQQPHYDDVVKDILRFFEERICFAMRAGIAEANIWLDPGFGFGKTADHNLELVRRLDAFLRFGRPVLLGASNKSTIGTVLNADIHDRAEGNMAVVAYAVAKGVHCVRVHDVRMTARVTRMADAIRRGRVSET